MKTATIPSLRVEPEFREAVEQVLGQNESLSQFVEEAIRASVHRRRSQAEFLDRGGRSLAAAKESGDYFNAGEVLQRLKRKLAAAKVPPKTDAR